MSAATKSASPAGTRRVLFVDDDVRFLETIRELMSVLSEGQWEVLAAESASRAFALMHEQVVDLVVIDVQMSVMDGIQMLSLLNRGHPNVQKVVLTGHASEKYRAACLSNGAELFLEKPTNPPAGKPVRGAERTDQVPARGGISRGVAPRGVAGCHPDGMSGTQFLGARGLQRRPVGGDLH